MTPPPLSCLLSLHGTSGILYREVTNASSHLYPYVQALWICNAMRVCALLMRTDSPSLPPSLHAGMWPPSSHAAVS